MPVMKPLTLGQIATIGFGRATVRAGLGRGVDVFSPRFQPGRKRGFGLGNVTIGLGHFGAAQDSLPGITFGGNGTAASDFMTGFTLDSNYGSWPGFVKNSGYVNVTEALGDGTNPWVIAQLPRLDSLSKIVGQNQPCGGWNGDPNCVFGNTCGCRGQAHSAAYLASTKALSAALVTFGNQYQAQLAAAGGPAVTTGSNTFSQGGAPAVSSGAAVFSPGANSPAGLALSPLTDDTWKYIAAGGAGLLGLILLVVLLKPKKSASAPAAA